MKAAMYICSPSSFPYNQKWRCPRLFLAIVVLSFRVTGSLADVALGLEKLPPQIERTVLGTWRMVEPDIRCTRSIERVKERYFLVARCPEIPGANGESGLPLAKVSDRIYRNKAGSIYEIQPDGALNMITNGHIDMRTRPQKELWPE